MQDLIRFKRKRAHQLMELGAKLEELNAKIKETGDRKDVEWQAKRIYERDVEKGLNDLAVRASRSFDPELVGRV